MTNLNFQINHSHKAEAATGAVLLKKVFLKVSEI